MLRQNWRSTSGGSRSSDGGGEPGSLIFSELVTDFHEVQLEGVFYGYCANFTNAFFNAPGTTYYLSIQSVFCR